MILEAFSCTKSKSEAIYSIQEYQFIGTSRLKFTYRKGAIRSSREKEEKTTFFLMLLYAVFSQDCTLFTFSVAEFCFVSVSGGKGISAQDDC